MDYENKVPLINLGEVIEVEDGTGGQTEGVDMKTIRKHLDNESKKSAKIK